MQHLLTSISGSYLKSDAVISEVLKDGDDVYIRVDNEKATLEKVCTRRGCSKRYTDATNGYDACQFHSEGPVFHEGMKGWMCCSKRVINFDECLAIPGCTYGPHTDYVDESQESTSRDKDNGVILDKVVDGISTYVPKNMPIKREQAVHKYGEKINVKDYITEEPDDPLDAFIAMGTKCRHNGCNQQFEGDHSRTEPCKYHPGQAIFHESSKYWSCCKPRCAEFEEFLKIEGCKIGRHKFLPKPGDITDEKFVKCRYDHYQYGDHVVVSVYAKNVVKDKTSVTFDTHQINVYVAFENGKRFEKSIPLLESICPDKSSFKIRNTKVEITLHKAQPSDWTSLEPQEF